MAFSVRTRTGIEKVLKDLEVFNAMQEHSRPRSEVKVIMWISVRCTKWHEGKECGALLCRVDSDRWEEAMTDAVEQKCDRCRQTYTLAEYR